MKCGYIATWLLGSVYVGEHVEHWSAEAIKRAADLGVLPQGIQPIVDEFRRLFNKRSPDL